MKFQRNYKDVACFLGHLFHSPHEGTCFPSSIILTTVVEKINKECTLQGCFLTKQIKDASGYFLIPSSYCSFVKHKKEER